MDILANLLGFISCRINCYYQRSSDVYQKLWCAWFPSYTNNEAPLSQPFNITILTSDISLLEIANIREATFFEFLLNIFISFHSTYFTLLNCLFHPKIINVIASYTITNVNGGFFSSHLKHNPFDSFYFH